MNESYRYEDLVVGLAAEQPCVVTPTIYEGFLKLFGDASPLHVPGAYPTDCGFAGPLMHGAILNGFISHFIGMVLPGGRSLELSVDIRFRQPFYLGDKLMLTGKIAQKLDVQSVVVVHFLFSNITRGGATAGGRVQVKMMNR